MKKEFIKNLIVVIGSIVFAFSLWFFCAWVPQNIGLSIWDGCSTDHGTWLEFEAPTTTIYSQEKCTKMEKEFLKVFQAKIDAIKRKEKAGHRAWCTYMQGKPMTESEFITCQE